MYVCPACGQVAIPRRVKGQAVGPDGTICPACGARLRFKRYGLLVVPFVLVQVPLGPLALFVP